MAENVVLGDASARACARNLAEIDVVVLGDLAHQRRGAQLSPDAASRVLLEALARLGERAAAFACRFSPGTLAAAAGLPAAPPITATMVLMPTVAPSCTLISVSICTRDRRPGISASTLSVEMLKQRLVARDGFADIASAIS